MHVFTSFFHLRAVQNRREYPAATETCDGEERGGGERANESEVKRRRCTRKRSTTLFCPCSGSSSGTRTRRKTTSTDHRTVISGSTPAGCENTAGANNVQRKYFHRTIRTTSVVLVLSPSTGFRRGGHSNK